MRIRTLPTAIELATEFNELSHKVHDHFFDEPDNYYRGGETLFLRTGVKDLSKKEFRWIMELVERCELPLSATCHAKYGGFFFVLESPRSSPGSKIMFGFEVNQVPLNCRADLRARFAGSQNRKLLGAYAMSKEIDDMLPYLDTSHSEGWAE